MIGPTLNGGRLRTAFRDWGLAEWMDAGLAQEAESGRKADGRRFVCGAPSVEFSAGG